jgi:hypothetical protein
MQNNTRISYWGLGHEKNGIVHVIGPGTGITHPGATIVCVILILQHMVLLVQLLLELEHLKLKWFCQSMYYATKTKKNANNSKW